jgi:alkylated DNA nucleotide flippase Atl1
MRECTVKDVPCHRVIAAGGALGGYGGNLELKRGLLRAEGLLVSTTRVRDFAERRWRWQGPTGTDRRRNPLSLR